MSLFDVYSANRGSAFQPPQQYDVPPIGFGGGGVPPAPPAPPRTFPERIDVNQLVGSVGQPDATHWVGEQALNLAHVAGAGPGFVFERPVALAQNILGLQPKEGEPQTRFGYGTIFDPIGQVVGDIIGLPDRVMASIINNTTASELKDNAGRPLGAPVNRGFDVAGTVSKALSLLATQGGTTNALSPDEGLLGQPERPALTVGQLLDNARARGFTAQEVADLQAGRRSTWDFAEKQLDADPMTDIALRLGTSPLNLLLGAGLISKAWRGVGLLSRMGAVRGVLPYEATGTWAGKTLYTRHALDAVTSSERIWYGASDAWKTTTLVGLGNFITKATRSPVVLGRFTVGQAYIGASAGLTAAELGLSALPGAGFTEGLRKTGQALLDNRPLSNNIVFSLWSAFHFPFHDIKTAFGTGVRQLKLDAVGHKYNTTLIDALGEGATFAERKAFVERELGGADRLAELRNHALVRIVMDPARGLLPKSIIDTYKAVGSFAEAVLAGTQLHSVVQAAVRNALAKNLIRPAEVVRAIKDWHGEQGGYGLGNAGEGLETRFAWNGPRALRNWARYRADAAKVSELYQQTHQFVVGLSDVMTKEQYEGAIGLLKQLAKDGRVAADDVREVLSLYPNVVGQETVPFFQNVGIENAPADISLRSAVTRLSNRRRNAPTRAELMTETNAWERTAPDAAPTPMGPMSRDGAIDAGYAPPVNSSSVAGSRYVDNRLHAMGVQPSTAAEARSLRNVEAIREAQGHVGDDLHESGFNVTRVSETIEVNGNLMRPGYDVTLNGASIYEQRIIGAVLGTTHKQPTVTISLSGEAALARGIKPNGVQIVWHLDLHDAAKVEAVQRLINTHFPDFSLKDAADLLDIKVIDGKMTPDAFDAAMADIDRGLRDIYGVDAIGNPNFTRSTSSAYIERIGKGPDATRSYESILRDAHNDPRLIGYRRIQRQRAADAATAARTGPTARPAGPANVGGSAGASGGTAGAGLGGSPSAGAGAAGVGGAGVAGTPDANGPVVAYKDATPEVQDQFAQTLATEGKLFHGTSKRMEGDEGQPSAGQGYFTTDDIRDARWYAAGEGSTRGRGAGTIEVVDPPKNPLDLNHPDPAQIQPVIDRMESDIATLRDARDGGVDPRFDPSNAYGLDAYGYVGALERALATAKGALRKGDAGELGAALHDVQLQMENITAAFEHREPSWYGNHYLTDVASALGHDATITSELSVAVDASTLGRHITVTVFHEKPPTRTIDEVFAERYWKNPAAARTPVAAELPPDATGRMHAVESVIHDAADPTIPPLQTTLRAEADLAATGNDWGQVLWNVYRDTEIGREFPVPRFDHTLEGVDVEFLQGLSALENQLHDINPAYTLKRAPGVSVFLEPAADTTVGGALRFRTKLGNMLDQFGPTSNFQRFWEALTAPRENVRMVREAKQALMNQLIPHGATPKQINLWLERQIEYARVSKIAPGRHTMTLFRGHGALTPGTVEELALGVFSDATIASVGPGNFWKLVDRAGNGYVRAAMSAGYRGEAGALQRAFTKFYTKSQDTTLGVGSRLVGKTFYQIYRFMVDPRWWLMNLMEADILGAMRYGFEATRFRDAHHAMLSAPAAAHGGVGPLTAEGAGLALNRDRSGYISRSFDAAKPQTVLDIINHMPANDPMIRELTQRFGPSKDVWAKEIDRMLYDYDTAGPKATVEEAARAEWSVEERQALEPLLTKVWQRNHETYTSIVNYFHGNNSRANWERVMNSYWLYWPLSYQLKATKWLFDVMTKGAFGYKTNLAGAAAFDQLMQMHKDRMAHDDAYAKIFVDHPVLWAVAQMLVPITPGDLGVSLSRPVRYAGGALGLWGAYAQASDPLTAAANIMVLGPTYTSELLQRVAREFKNAH